MKNTYWEIIDTQNGTVFTTTTETFAGFKFVAKMNKKVVFKTNDPEKATEYMDSLRNL